MINDTTSRPPVSALSTTPAESYAIELDAVEHVYRTRHGAELHAVAPTTMSIRQGEFAAIIGPSGCGKSTILKIVAGLITPTSGTTLVQGHSPSRRAPDFGMVFQSPVLLPWRDVVNNVALPLEVQGVDKDTRLAEAHRLLELVGLEGFEDASPRELSGGMQQRVALARALSTDPPLLLMDEPFGALDALTREQLNLELLKICARTDKAVVLVTHSIQEAVFLADRVFVMSPRPGTIVDDIAIDLDRPRDLELMGTERFGAYTNEVRASLTGKEGR